MFSSTDNSIMYCYFLLWIVKKTTVYKSEPLYMNTSSFMTTIDTFQVSIRITYPDDWIQNESVWKTEAPLYF